MFPNLKAEMARYGYKTRDISKVLKITDKSVRNKLNGKTPLTIDEATLIKMKLFPKKTIDFLFSKDIDESEVS